MCEYCEGEKDLIDTGVVVGDSLKVCIWKDNLVAEGIFTDVNVNHTINKGVKIKYCPMCGKEVRG